MAVNHSSQPTSNSGNQLPLFGNHQISPADSASNSPHNASPTSPRSNLQQHYHLPGQVRQLRPLKSPLYVPAALRPTERPVKSAPTTPPKSLHGSLESLENAGHTKVDHPIAAPSDLDVAESAGFVDEDLGPVTGEPTREHWKQDKQSTNCDSPQCNIYFNIFRRRHHCRHCGHIFCSDHSKQSIPLNQEARFHPDAARFRACDTCHRHYQRWDNARNNFKRHQREAEENSRQHAAGHQAGGSEDSTGSGQRAIPKGIPTGTPEQPPGSLPREWSTF